MSRKELRPKTRVTQVQQLLREGTILLVPIRFDLRRGIIKGRWFVMNAFNGVNIMSYPYQVRDDRPSFITPGQAIHIDELDLFEP